MFDSMFIIFTQLRSTYDYESHKNHRRSLQGDDEDRLRWNFPQSGQPNPVAGTYVPERIMPFDDVIFGNCSNSAFYRPPPTEKKQIYPLSVETTAPPPPGVGGAETSIFLSLRAGRLLATAKHARHLPPESP